MAFTFGFYPLDARCTVISCTLQCNRKVQSYLMGIFPFRHLTVPSEYGGLSSYSSMPPGALSNDYIRDTQTIDGEVN